MRPGDTVTVGGAGFQPAEQVTVTLLSTPVRLTTQTADSSGGVSYTFVVPDLAPGAHSVELGGATSGEVASSSFEVLAAPTSPTDPGPMGAGPTSPFSFGGFQPAGSGGSGRLARTGTDTVDLVPLAIALLTLGAALVATTRRRRIGGHL